MRLRLQARQASEGEGKGKDEFVKREKIGREKIFCAQFDFPPFLRPATQASNFPILSIPQNIFKL